MTFPLNRQISLRITPWLARLRLTPNQVTWLSLGMGLLAASYFLQGSPQGWLAGAVCLQISYLLDNCDGELARITATSSGFGSWLDVITDCLIHVSFFLSLGLGLYRMTSEVLWFRLGATAAVGVFLTYVTFVVTQVQQRGRSAWIHPDPPVGGPLDFWGRLKATLRGDFSLVVLGCAFLGKMAWLLWGGVFGSFFYWVPSAVLLVRGRRR